MTSVPPIDPIDLEAAARLVAQLERDLANARGAGGDADHIARLRADVEQLRAALAEAPAHEEVHAGLSALQQTLHAAREELQRDAFTVGDYIARVGRLLGL